ncbi:hypothetical protein J1605_008947 [Eschrichtius robustus]|uniref:Uncharacterized protein n=1 Tax=Eschrichtius robustus TaxID=9764 RepID=A0AB34GZR1_ESCRO|nr:hypothetical protein J1605_008947 [Eschrichtius robustus]
MRKGFPGGAVVENLSANAGDTGSCPDLGRSHMPRSNWAREPQLLSLRIWSLCSATREAATTGKELETWMSSAKDYFLSFPVLEIDTNLYYLVPTLTPSNMG